jgi:trigger factor
MQVFVESIGKLERRMQVQVPAARVSTEIAARLKTLSRTARLNGFRPGKAPLTVIRRQFGPQVHREVIGELLQSTFSEAVAQQQLAPAGNPRIQPQTVDEGKDLTYVATFEVFPEVTLAPVETLQIERTTAAVTEADIDAMIERLRRQSPKYVAATRPAANGDRVTVDFEGSVDGVPFAGGSATGVPVVHGDGRMLADFEAGLIGTAGGDEKSIDVAFPADYRAKDLAGKTAQFRLSVKSVEEAQLPELDEEFCKSFGVTEGGIAALRDEVAANMRRELEVTLRNRNKSVVMDRLLLANPVDVPNALIEGQVRDMQVEAMRRAGVTDPAQAPAAQQFLEPARRRAALGLILGEIIRRQGLVADPVRVEARLDEIVGVYGDTAALRASYQQNPQAMRQVESLALEDQATDWVLGAAAVTEVGSTFKDIMKFEG